MNGVGWNENGNWLSDDDYCTWFGVTCTNRILDVFRIEGINLGMNKLRGVIPLEVSLLKNLLHLSLYSNKITGTLPLIVFSRIQTIDLYDNQLQGEIPESLYDSTTLKSLHLANNYLSGSLGRIGDLSNLTEFTASNNLLTGVVPDGINNLVHLGEYPFTFCVFL